MDRRGMLATIERDVEATRSLLGKETLDPRVLAALASVPRHEFVPPGEETRAYLDCALPIGYGQTISQPFVVAVMTDALDVGPGDVVLEVGTGSGYQAAVLSRLVERVYSIERIPELAEAAAERLARLGYDNVHVRVGDGALGLPEFAPYDGIIVTAGAREIPLALVEQLRPGRRLVIPVGPPTSQELRIAERDPDGKLRARAFLPVAFVPLLPGTATQ
jgi:protein-L-isoaspartate(D-aspartate) O-methyltransferase